MIIMAMSLCTGCGQSDEVMQKQYLETAKTALRQGAYEKAQLALSHIPATSPRSKAFYLMEGLAAFKLREFHRAMDAFEKAAPSSPALKRQMSYLYLILDEVERAETLLAEMRAVDGATPTLALLHGNIKLWKRSFNASRRAFEAAASTMDQPAQAHLGLGNVALFKKDMAAAEQHFLAAMLMAPHHRHVYHILATFYVLINRYEDAEATLNIALKKFFRPINTVILLGNVLIQQGRCTETLALFETYRPLLPASSVLNLQTLRCMLKEKQYEQAGEVINAFESKNSRKTLLVSGELNLRQGNVEAALSDFYRIAATQDDFIVDYYLGVVYLLQGEMDLALSYLVKSLQKNPQYIPANLLIAVIHLMQHDSAMALKYATWALQLAPDHVQAHAIQGLALYFEKRVDEALEVFKRVAARSPEHPLPYFFEALVLRRRHVPFAEEKVQDLLSYLRATYIEPVFLKRGADGAGRHADAPQMRRLVADLSTYLDTSPSLIGALLVADYTERMGDLDQAEVLVRKALEMREDCAFCFYKLAYFAHLRHDRAQAISLLQQALEWDAQLIAAYVALGGVYEQTGAYSKAAQSYERGLKIDPNHVTLLNNLGWVTLAELRDPATAYVHIRKAASLSPNDPDVRDSLAWWYYQNGEIERAVFELQPLVQAHPTHPVYQYHAGMAYLAHGDRSAGQHHLRLALRHGLRGEAAALARERLP